MDKKLSEIYQSQFKHEMAKNSLWFEQKNLFLFSQKYLKVTANCIQMVWLTIVRITYLMRRRKTGKNFHKVLVFLPTGFFLFIFATKLFSSPYFRSHFSKKYVTVIKVMLVVVPTLSLCSNLHEKHIKVSYFVPNKCYHNPSVSVLIKNSFAMF